MAPDSSSNYTSTYLHTAQRIAEKASNLSSLRQILYTSSLSVYGDHQGNWIDEQTIPTPGSANAKILLDAEQILLKCANSALKVCILRLGEIYGPGREIEERIKRTIHTPFAGTGTSYTNLIHVNDIVGALDFALQRNLNGIYNLCNDDHILRKMFYEQLCQRMHLPAVCWDPTLTSSHPGNRRASNSKLKSEGFNFANPHYFMTEMDC